jgi:predicted glutamine amidotransferase
MCRWAAWSGTPRHLEDLICNPVHSLIRQSRHAQACLTPVNGDGFGMARYGARPEPCLYKDIRPDWSDPNLSQLAHHTRAGLFTAHIRASTGTDTTHANCHQFSHARWSFMRNGQIGGYERIRKGIDGLIPDTLYHARTGATDSEALFLMARGCSRRAMPPTTRRRACFIAPRRTGR